MGSEPALNHLQKHVLCPYAKKAKIWENKFLWEYADSFENNVERFIKKDLENYVTSARDFDVIALEFPANLYAKNFEQLAKTLNKVLFTISPKSVESLSELEPEEEGYYLDNGWQFSYGGERFFITSFAPFYPLSSSRQIYGHDNALILFQPERSFKKYLPFQKEKIKKLIRNRFSKAGQQYAPDRVVEDIGCKKRHEAPRYVKPISLEGIVEWWKKYD